MASTSVSDDRLVYTTFNDIFKGQDAYMRKRKSVQRLVEQHRKRAGVAQLINKYGLGPLVDKVRCLLTEGIFESTLCAKKKFPELFEVSSAQSAERAASEAAAAAQQAQTLEEAAEEALEYDVGSCGGDSGIDNESPVESPVSKPPKREVPAPTPARPENPTTAIQVPSLFPMYLPFATGHRILVRTQLILETACFRFASETIPEVCAQRSWDCPEATELNVIVWQLLKQKASLHKLQAAATATAAAGGAAPQGLMMLANSMVRLRHATVHRGRLTAKVLEKLLVDAEALAARLNDKEATAALARTRRGVQENVVEMENNKSMLETSLRRTLDDIAAQRAELDRLEKAAVVDVLRADAEYQGFIGMHLEQSLEQGDGEMSDVGDGEDDGPGQSEGSASGSGDGNVDELRGGCETEGGDEWFEDAQEIDPGVCLVFEIPGVGT
ncbi:hypothetical protein VMCG_06789 [Cytospora schulzeri]|uniref:Ubiquinol-cytochrome-c reductase cytochrome c1 n=1 Tax=Cytospora schulzeri TaxID=448051 RepID=A0A423W607_9PEZI|nr:hypothetical protein VMCG_06789 [Valsa malicola]